MNIPGFTSEASLYKSTSVYRGHSGGTRLDTASNVVAAASDCEIACGVADLACLTGCSIFLGPICAFLCQVGTVACLEACQGGGGSGGGGGGGGGGTGGPCGCPQGTKCCGGCTKVSGHLVCNDECIKKGEVCP
jgi:hypothetical protein